MNAFKEAAKKRKTAPGGAEKEPEVEVVPSQEIEETEKEPTGEIAALLSGIGGEKKPQKKSSTLYLSATNLGELKKRAKKAGVSSSEFLDKVLTKLFFDS